VATLRSLPWVKRTVLTAEDRNRIYLLPADLAVYVGPTSPRYRGRTWRCQITRAVVPIADVAGYPTAREAIEAAVAVVERRESAA
jgi:hypothetical protein